MEKSYSPFISYYRSCEGMQRIQKNAMFKIAAVIISIPVFYLTWKYNHKIFFLINGLYGDFFGYPMIFLTAMADGLFVIMISSAVYPKKKGYFWSFLIAYLVTNSIVNLIKYFYSTGRPLAYYSLEQIFYAGEILRYQSFPSGHAAAAMVLTRYLLQDAGKKLSILIWVFGTMCAVSRVYIGVHFPYDVLVGGSLGFFISHGIFWYAHKKYKHSGRPEYRHNTLLISMTGLGAAIFYLFFNRDQYEPLSTLVNFTALLFGIFFGFLILKSFWKIYQEKPKS